MGQISYSLVDQPWIKLIDGEYVSLKSFFELDSPPTMGGTPIQRLVLFRLLLAIVYRACPLETEDDFEALTIDSMKTSVLRYLEAHRSAFDLWDEQKPFLQHPGISSAKPEKELAPGAFMPGVCSGNATLLFDSNCLTSDLSDSDLVYTLLTLVTFGLGGKKGDKDLVFSPGHKKKSAPASPALGRGWLHSFPIGDNLYETLKLNCLSQEIIDDAELEFLSAGVGVPAWEDMPTTEVGKDAAEYASSLCGWLVPVSRFCRLLGRDRLYMTSGVEYPKIDTGICDLSVSTKTGGTKTQPKMTAVRANRSLEPWRQLDAVLAFFGGNKKSGCRGLQLAFERRPMFVKGIWCVGMQVSEQSGEQYMSGDDDFVESVFLVPNEWQGTIFLNEYKEEMLNLDHIRRVLYSSVMKFYEELKAADVGKSKAERAQATFWTLCSPLGSQWVQACGKGETVRLRHEFQKAAWQAYDLVCPKGTSKQLMAYEKCRPIFKFKKLNEVKK